MQNNRALRGADAAVAAFFGAAPGARWVPPDELRAHARWLASQLRPTTIAQMNGFLGEAFASHFLLCTAAPGFSEAFVWTALGHPGARTDFELGDARIEVKATMGRQQRPQLSNAQFRDHVGPDRIRGLSFWVVRVTEVLSKRPRAVLWGNMHGEEPTRMTLA
jgi:hypothetical protein